MSVRVLQAASESESSDRLRWRSRLSRFSVVTCAERREDGRGLPPAPLNQNLTVNCENSGRGQASGRYMHDMRVFVFHADNVCVCESETEPAGGRGGSSKPQTKTQQGQVKVR